MDYFFNFEKMAYVKGKRPDGCILCLIRDGSDDVEDLLVFSDERFLVTVNLYPYNPGHLMIFPRRHLLDIRDYNEPEERRLSDLTRLFLDVLEETHNPSGFNVGYNMGFSAGASIGHIHLHIIPRYPRETGISDLIGGRRVLIEHPYVTRDRVRRAAGQRT